MGLSFDGNGRYVGWSNLFDYSSLSTIKASEYLPMPKRKVYNKTDDGFNIDAFVVEIVGAPTAVDRINGYVKLITYLNENNITDINYTVQEGAEVLAQLRMHEFTKIPQSLIEEASKNFISSHIQNTIQNLRNMIGAYSPIDMEVFRSASEASPKGEQASKMTLLNPSTKLFMQYQNITGKNVIGIAANGEKASFMWHYYINDVIQKTNTDTKSFQTLFNQVIDNYNRTSQTPYEHINIIRYITNSSYRKDVLENYSNITELQKPLKDLEPYIEKVKSSLFSFKTTRLQGRSSGNIQPQEVNTLPDVNFEGVNPELIAQYGIKMSGDITVDLMISQILSAATDNAKELILAKVNAGNKLAKMYLFLVTLGFNINDIVKFMTSPVVSFIDAVTEANIFTGQDTSIPDAIKLARGDFKKYYQSFMSKRTLSKIGNLDNGSEIKKKLAAGITEGIKNVFTKGSTEFIEFENALNAIEEAKYILDSAIDNEVESVAKSNPSRSKEDIREEIINSIPQDIDEFENILEGANEFSYFGRILGFNQGLPTSKADLQEKVQFIQKILSDRESASRVDGNILDDKIWTDAARRTGKSKEFVKDFWENKVPREYKVANITEEELQTASLIFDRVPELAKIGTPAEYAAYIKEIFPNSVEKEVYWHGSNEDFSEGFTSAKRGEGSGALETKKRNDLYLNKQGWASLQYVNGINRKGRDKNGFAHWNKLWWELKEIMSNGRRENNDWKDIVIDESTIRQAIPNKKGVFNRDSGGKNGKWLSERKADYGYENKSDKEFFEEIFGIKLGKDTFNTWTARNAEIFKSLEKSAKGINPVVIDVRNPIIEEGQNTYYEEQRGLFTIANAKGNDAILSKKADNEFNSDVAVVINANNDNVYWLGTKSDIERFRQWKTNNNASKVVDENGEPLVVYRGSKSISIVSDAFAGENVDGELLDVRKLFIDKAYRKEIKDRYEKVKKCINIFNITDHIPQFNSIFKIFSAVMDIDHNISIKTRKFDAVYKELKEGQYRVGYMSEEYQTRLLKGIDDAIITKFINNSGIRIPYKAGVNILNDLRQVVPAREDSQIEFNSLSDVASFKYLFETYIIPLLKQGKYIDVQNGQNVEVEDKSLSTNKFIQSLIRGDDHGMPLYKCDLDMLTIENSQNSKVKFQSYLKGLQELQKIKINGMSLSDMFVLYNLIVNKNQYGSDKMTTLFDQFIQNTGSLSLIKEYLNYVGKLDYSGSEEELQVSIIDLLKRAAAVVNSEVGQKDPTIIVNTDSGPVLMIKSRGGYERFSEIIPKVSGETQDEFLARIYNHNSYYVLGGVYSETIDRQVQALRTITNQTLDILNQLLRQGVLTIQKIC